MGLQKKICEYFSKACKTMAFSVKPLEECCREYADKVYGSLWTGLGDRDWLEQVDWTPCVHAAIQENFPPQMLQQEPPHIFQQTVLGACERANDGWKYYTYRWDVIQKIVSSKAAQKKARDALDYAREEVVKQELGTVALFL